MVSNHIMNRWAINIDIEGFSLLWEKEDQVLRSLGELMLAIFRIGRNCYPGSPERLFAHQLGDGFFVVSDFYEDSLERAITIGTAIMQHVANSGRFTKAVIAEGELSDIQSCYPKEVLKELEGDHTVSLEMGLMTIFPVMGTALINSYKLAEKSPKGPLLLLEKSMSDRIPPEIAFRGIQGYDNLISVDWVHMDTQLLRKIQSCAGLHAPGAEYLEKILHNYCADHGLTGEWVINMRTLLDVAE